MNRECNQWNLVNLTISVKVLFTGFLMAIGLGLMMAGAQIMMTHGMADGKPGLSMDDVVYSYYGDKTSSKLELKLNGSMQDKAPPEVRLDMIKWARSGAPEDQWEPKIKPLFDQHCVMCHSTIPGIPSFKTYEDVQTVVSGDHGASFNSLTRVSHIHLFGIAFIFFIVGFIFSFAANINQKIKSLVIAIPFIFLILDVLSWWLTKITPEFAILTIMGGVGYSLASTYMILVSLYQMWLLPGRCRGAHQGDAWGE